LVDRDVGRLEPWLEPAAGFSPTLFGFVYSQAAASEARKVLRVLKTAV
jgi:hypothetical protein